MNDATQLDKTLSNMDRTGAALPKLLAAALIAPTLFLTACAPEPSDIMTGAAGEAAASVDEVVAEDSSAADEVAEGAEAAEEMSESEDASAGHQMGGMRHQRMKAAMHEQMLSSGVEQGLITEEDALFFTETHPIIEEYHPEEAAEGSSMPGDAKKAMQRGIANMAIAAGALSQEDADRFTEIHDILIEAGLMNE